MKVVILVVYADDVVIIGNNGDEITRLKSYMKFKFEIKDLGNFRYFLGIKVARSKYGICISQCKYTLYLLEATRNLGVKPVDSPLKQNDELYS